MTWKSILSGIISVVVFFILVNLIPKSKGGSAAPNYAPDGWSKTIQASINGVVQSTEQNGLLWVTINNSKLPFSYDALHLPVNWEHTYPKEFIEIGDSILKKANSDTFYLIRDGKSWQYILPK